MNSLTLVHTIVAALVLALTLVVGVWGLTRATHIAEGPREGRLFAHLLQGSHTAVFGAGLLGLALLMDGRHPHDGLHARVYGPFMVVAILAAYGYRTPNAARNIRIFAIASLVIFALALRAVTTAA